jgi:hypothetical protein
MAAEDLVIYNGISMRRDYAESLESEQRLGSYRVGGRDIARLRFGEETNPNGYARLGLVPVLLNGARPISRATL